MNHGKLSVWNFKKNSSDYLIVLEIRIVVFIANCWCPNLINLSGIRDWLGLRNFICALPKQPFSGSSAFKTTFKLLHSRLKNVLKAQLNICDGNDAKRETLFTIFLRIFRKRMLIKRPRGDPRFYRKFMTGKAKRDNRLTKRDNRMV